MNYLQFVDAIQQFAECYEQTFVDNIPVFLRVTEKRVFNHVQPPLAKQYKTGVLVAGASTIQKPTDYLSADYLRIFDSVTSNTIAYLLHKDQSYLREAFGSAANGTPYAYADTNETILTLAPGTSAACSYELAYFGYPASIVDAQDGRSWLGDNYEQALLYGALREAAIFQKEDKDVVSYYDSLFQQGMADVRLLGAVKNQRDTYRKGAKQ
jgi:hypothetical protein